MKAREQAQGKWRAVLTELGIPGNVLDKRPHPCPSNGEGVDRFRFADRAGTGNFFCHCSDGDKGGLALLMCCKGLSYAEAAKEVERVAGNANQEPEQDKRDPREALNRVHARAKPAGKAVADYLQGRGLSVPPSIKQARLRYWDRNNSLGDFDCMVARVSGPDGKPQSYHITYLKDGQKAPVPSPRKIMTPIETVSGGAVRLYPAAEDMGVAEGIETAIAAHMMHGVPVWAALTAGGVESFVPPKVCKRLTIFGDTDPSYTGQAAAYALAKRMVRSGIECVVSLPPAGDWNDALRGAA
jgi:putative DNA primase/helicase